jgi:hypothetical protein
MINIHVSVRQNDESNMAKNYTPQPYPGIISCINSMHKIYFLNKKFGNPLHLQQNGTIIFKMHQVCDIEQWDHKSVHSNGPQIFKFVSFH